MYIRIESDSGTINGKDIDDYFSHCGIPVSGFVSETL
jgi:hypothetical protein